jgi:hypothetical protein
MGYTTQCGADQITNVPDRLFHASALDEMFAFMYTSSGNSCPIKVPTGNFQPIVNAGLDYKIPLNTPFQLTGSAYDPDGDSLLFNWEEMDLGPEGGPNNPVGNAPTFRVFPPVKTTTRIFPRLSNIITNTQNKGEKMPFYPRNMRMRLLARDNKPMAGAFGFDEMNIEVVSNAGPFVVNSFNFPDTVFAGSMHELKWDVANTTASPLNCSKVGIAFATDNGLTFPIKLKDTTANDGSENIIIPNNITNLGRIKVYALGSIYFIIKFTNTNLNRFYWLCILFSLLAGLTQTYTLLSYLLISLYICIYCGNVYRLNGILKFSGLFFIPIIGYICFKTF